MMSCTHKSPFIHENNDLIKEIFIQVHTKATKIFIKMTGSKRSSSCDAQKRAYKQNKITGIPQNISNNPTP
jgi:hypothetical protein